MYEVFGLIVFELLAAKVGVGDVNLGMAICRWSVELEKHPVDIC